MDRSNHNDVLRLLKYFVRFFLCLSVSVLFVCFFIISFSVFLFFVFVSFSF